MLVKARWHDIELPKPLRTRPRDPRGYPIPFIVLIDTSGTPQYSINDVRKTRDCRTKKLCGLCGKRMLDGFWFIGGARCFLHPMGGFLDPPNHLECVEYALRVCPYLAARRYSKRIDDAKLDPRNVPKGAMIVQTDAVPEPQPERFGLGHTMAYEFFEQVGGHGVFAVGSWDYVEWWRNGERCGAPDSAIPDPIPD